MDVTSYNSIIVIKLYYKSVKDESHSILRSMLPETVLKLGDTKRYNFKSKNLFEIGIHIKTQ